MNLTQPPRQRHSRKDSEAMSGHTRGDEMAMDENEPQTAASTTLRRRPQSFTEEEPDTAMSTTTRFIYFKHEGPCTTSYGKRTRHLSFPLS